MVNILVAYPYFKKPIREWLSDNRSFYNDLMVDSGAFTAFNSGEDIELWEYENFLDGIKHMRPTYQVQLDVIGDHKATWNNYKEMRKNGFDVIPVFTRGTDWVHLEDMYLKSDFVLLGGVARGERRAEYVKEFLKRNKGRKCHLLGFTNQWIVNKFSPYSIDASSWVATSRFGGIDIFVENKGIYKISKEKVVKDRVKLMRFLTKKNPILGEWLEKYVADLKQRNSGKWGEVFFAMISTYSWVEYATWVEKVKGTKFFFSANTTWQFDFIKNAALEFERRPK